MAKTVDVVQQLHDATTQRDSLAASIPKLKVDAENAAVTRRDLTERLELKEGDALIGKVTDSELAAARAKAEAATIEARKAQAAVREAEAGGLRGARGTVPAAPHRTRRAAACGAECRA
jgi:hypothetical protein